MSIFSEKISRVKNRICIKYLNDLERYLSPVLFSLYLNDLERYLQIHVCSGVSPDIDDIGILLETGPYLLCLL